MSVPPASSFVGHFLCCTSLISTPCFFVLRQFYLYPFSDVLGACIAIHMWLFVKFRASFLQELKEPWRVVDMLVFFFLLFFCAPPVLARRRHAGFFISHSLSPFQLPHSPCMTRVLLLICPNMICMYPPPPLICMYPPPLRDATPSFTLYDVHTSSSSCVLK